MIDVLIMCGVPSGLFGLFIWLFKRSIDKREKTREAREEKVEQLMLYILQDCRATTVLATATAKAVQRIPDAQCNGDMTRALETAAEIQSKEKDFVFNQGIEHIFGTTN